MAQETVRICIIDADSADGALTEDFSPTLNELIVTVLMPESRAVRVDAWRKYQLQPLCE
jgi:hypothetical protein